MENYYLCGGIRKKGVYMEHEYDKLVLSVTTSDDMENNVFGFGTPVSVKLKTEDVLKAFGLTSYSELCLLKFPVPVRLFFGNSKDGFYVSGIQPIKKA